MNERNEALLEVIRQGLEISGEIATQNMLGNRASYLGISDLAKYAECPRAALLAKIYPQNNSLNRLLTLQRGHWFEDGLSSCFTALDLKFITQLEISIFHRNIPIKAHLDFTLVWDKPQPAIRIVEAKSMSKLPKSPYETQVFQAQAQVNLLRKIWNEPVFAIRSASGDILYSKCTLPQICTQTLGIQLPDNPEAVSIESWILGLSMQEAAAYGPYEYDAQSLENMYLLAENCWSQYGLISQNSLEIDNLPYLSGFNPLCSYCEFNADCPKFDIANMQRDLNGALQRHEQLKEKRTCLDEEIKEIETALKTAHQNSGGKGWIDTGKYRFRISEISGRKTLDADSLKNELTEIFREKGLPAHDVDALFARHQRIGAACSRLNIMPIN